MDIQWWEIVGLIGVTLVMTAGKVFEGLRDWLNGFENWWSPLRIVGNLLSCSMCSGIWVGFLWGWLVKGWPWYAALILGGCISIAALVTDEAVGLLALYRLMRKKKSQGSMTMEELVAVRQQQAAIAKQRKADQMAQARARRRGTPRDMTETEAEAYADAQEEAADKLILGEPDEAA